MIFINLLTSTDRRGRWSRWTLGVADSTLRGRPTGRRGSLVLSREPESSFGGLPKGFLTTGVAVAAFGGRPRRFDCSYT